MEIVSFGINSVKASEKDEAMIKGLQKNAVFRNANMAAVHLVGAQVRVMQDAAKNQGGAFTGFMGMNMAQQGGGINAAQMFQMGAQQQAPQQSAPVQPGANAWKCACGAKKPEPSPRRAGRVPAARSTPASSVRNAARSARQARRSTAATSAAGSPPIRRIRRNSARNAAIRSTRATAYNTP